MTMAARTNYIQHLNAFFAQVRKDDRLHANHISLYVALFQVWNQYRFRSPFPILREEVIRLCRIGSLNTYTRCLKDLHSLGYVIYQPAPQRGAPSLVSVVELKINKLEKDAIQLSLFQELSFQALHPSFILDRLIEMASPALTPCSKNDIVRRKNDTAASRNSDTGSVAKLRHFNNKQLNNKKRERENTRSPSKKNIKNEVKNNHTRLAAAPPDGTPVPPAVPTLQEVQQFFQSASYPDQEGRKFFYHYQANGWRLGGKTAITDWQAAAHKWILNIKPPKTDFDGTRNTKPPTQPGRLHANEDKSYSDPL